MKVYSTEPKCPICGEEFTKGQHAIVIDGEKKYKDCKEETRSYNSYNQETKSYSPIYYKYQVPSEFRKSGAAKLREIIHANCWNEVFSEIPALIYKHKSLKNDKETTDTGTGKAKAKRRIFRKKTRLNNILDEE